MLSVSFTVFVCFYLFLTVIAISTLRNRICDTLVTQPKVSMLGVITKVICIVCTVYILCLIVHSYLGSLQ